MPASIVLVPRVTATGGPLGLIRRTGYRLVRAATRDLRRLEEYVVETCRVRRREADELVLGRMDASYYARARA